MKEELWWNLNEKDICRWYVLILENPIEKIRYINGKVEGIWYIARFKIKQGKNKDVNKKYKDGKTGFQNKKVKYLDTYNNKYKMYIILK